MKRNRFRRWRVAGLLGAVLLAIGVPSAVAVHDFDPPAGDNDLFELDNDAIDQAEIPGVNFAGDDWDTVLLGGGGSADDTTGLLTDFFNVDDDTFCGGTKEIDDLGAWKWCDNTAANDKNDLEHAYAATYIVPDGFEDEGHTILYVGADRFANNGDSGLGFMFLQTGLEKTGEGTCHTNCTFNDGEDPAGTPAHVDGDIYVVTQFTGGVARTPRWTSTSGTTGPGGSYPPRASTATIPRRTTLPVGPSSATA